MNIPVLDLGYVSLVEGWGKDESIIEAARMSTGKGFTEWGPIHSEDCLARWNFLTDRPKASCTCTPKPGDEKLLAYLYNHKHATPFEMAGLVLEVKAPIFVFREWHRHRTQSYNEMSARYIPLPDENYVPKFEHIVERSGINANKQASGLQKCDEEHAKVWLLELVDLYEEAQRVYARGIELGVPKELARLPVPVARYSRMRVSANLRNWLAFLTLRMSPDAQWEIRQYANAVGSIVADRFPRTWTLFSAEQNRP